MEQNLNKNYGELYVNVKNPNVVHQVTCDGYGKIIGVIVDDDYHGLDKLYCPICMNKAKRHRWINKIASFLTIRNRSKK